MVEGREIDGRGAPDRAGWSGLDLVMAGRPEMCGWLAVRYQRMSVDGLSENHWIDASGRCVKASRIGLVDTQDYRPS